MIKAIIFDFSKVLINHKDPSIFGSLNNRHKELKNNEGYQLFDHFILNQELLDYLNKLKESYPLYIFTNGALHLEKEVTAEINHIFIKIYTDNECGKKDNPKSFQKLAEILNQNPKELLFVDDTEENVIAAKEAGFEVIQYKNNNQLFKDLEHYLRK